MSTHVMTDIETLGNGNFACILSIGSCKFDPQDDGVTDKFQVYVNPESCQKIGLRIDASTVMWWMDPLRDAARAKMMAIPSGDRLDIHDALDGFSQWYGSTSLPTWSNGSNFDNVILTNAFKLAGMECPWKFWDDRCFRTLKNLTGYKLPRSGLAHDALDDAVYQAESLQIILRHLGIML